ncbi:MAG: translation elongation factor Ts [bacterium]
MMAAVQANDVKELRDKTGAGILDCKEALNETDGDIEEASEYLREQGLKEAGQKSGVAAEGKIGAYVHTNGSIGVIVEVNCETDFVADTDEFSDFVDELAMQIAAQGPSYISREDVPEDDIESEKQAIRAQFEDEDKPEDVLDDIVEGKLEKEFFQEEVLLEQEYIRDSDKTIEELQKEVIASVDENVEIRRFERFEVGEGVETEDENFAEEVADEID